MQPLRAYHEAFVLSSHRGEIFVNPHIKSLRDLRVSFVLTSFMFRVIMSSRSVRDLRVLVRVFSTRFSC